MVFYGFLGFSGDFLGVRRFSKGSEFCGERMVGYPLWLALQYVGP